MPDTGLTPEQCKNAKTIIESAFADDTSKAERIQELLKADKEHRVVVLPCKVGDTVWRLQYVDKGNGTFPVEPVEQRFNLLTLSEFGETVFLTREEAERALEERRNKE